MKSCVAFSLGGGGARGALQVGAMRALFEAGIKPDLLVGTSIGAVNAVGLALWGADPAGLETLARVYAEVAAANLMDPRLGRLTLRVLSGKPNHYATQRVADFLISKGLTPDLRFDQIPGPRLALVGADLDTGRPMIYGRDPNQSVLEGVLASIALPPWFAPAEKDGRMIIDGGALSNLPIEPALQIGATRIYALDLNDPSAASGNGYGLNQFFGKYLYSIMQRQMCLETALSEAQGVPVRYMLLTSTPSVPLWDFGHTQELIEIGYEIATGKLAEWELAARRNPARPALVPAY